MDIKELLDLIKAYGDIRHDEGMCDTTITSAFLDVRMMSKQMAKEAFVDIEKYLNGDDMTKVRFLGASKEQIAWGSNDDPNPILEVGSVYEVDYKDVRSQHTKIKLVGIDAVFNDVSFEYLK